MACNHTLVFPSNRSFTIIKIELIVSLIRIPVEITVKYIHNRHLLLIFKKTKIILLALKEEKFMTKIIMNQTVLITYQDRD